MGAAAPVPRMSAAEETQCAGDAKAVQGQGTISYRSRSGSGRLASAAPGGVIPGSPAELQMGRKGRMPRTGTGKHNVQASANQDDSGMCLVALRQAYVISN